MLLIRIIEFAREGRKILVLSERKDQLTTLKRGFERAVTPRGRKCPYSTGYYVGSRKIAGKVKKMKKEEREVSKSCDIIFATYKMAAEALDIKGLNTLIMGTPISNGSNKDKGIRLKNKGRGF